ncbi:MAG: twin-arginine translocation pathway signal protein [Pseudomonadota bacterium]
MALSRRQTLSILGGGAILAAGGVGYRVTRKPNAALAPWGLAGSYDDPRKNALSYAILAPNPHNRQPWIVDLSEPDTAVLYVDTNRLLPETDPFSRQITIGLGCFLELGRMAAAEAGQRMSVELFPEGFDDSALDSRPVAVCRFKEGAVKDPLFQYVMERRSLKEPYDLNRPVAPDILSAVLAAAQGTQVGGTVAEADVIDLRRLTHDALIIEIETPNTHKESVDLFRIGYREVNANPDGIDFSGPLFEAASVTGMFTREAALDRTSNAYQQGVAAVTANADTAMGFIWQVTGTNTRIDQIAAGRDWLRLNLATTSLGLATQPMSQALQEYPEMDGLYREVHQKLAPGGGTVQMLGRIGYGMDVPVSPRWPLDAKIRNG